MGRSRRDEESVQPDHPLSHSPQDPHSYYGGWDRRQDENDLRDVIPDEKYSPSPPTICPSQRIMSENPSEPNPSPRAHRCKKNLEHTTLSTIISAQLKSRPYVVLYVIFATVVVVYAYKYDIIASIALSTIFIAAPLILYAIPSFSSFSQIFSNKPHGNKRKDDIPEEINAFAEENTGDRRINYHLFEPQHSSQELSRREIQTESIGSTYDTAIVESHSSHSTRPELAAGFISVSGLMAWGASRRGRSHVNDDIPRQDSFGIRAIPDGLVAAVADGVGSTEFAERASEAAVAACMEFNWFAPRSEDDWNDEVMKAIDSISQAIMSAVRNLSYNEKQPPSTTIAAAIVTRSSKGYMLDWFSIGDSAIMIIPFDSSGQIDTINKAPLANSPATAALPRLSQESWRLSRESWIECGHGVCIDLNSSNLVLATDGCFKPMYQCPGPYIQNFYNIVYDVADASHLLAAIRQDGVGHADDSTAILISATGD